MLNLNLIRKGKEINKLNLVEHVSINRNLIKHIHKIFQAEKPYHFVCEV